jgi:fatty acid amide hydrolase
MGTLKKGVIFIGAAFAFVTIKRILKKLKADNKAKALESRAKRKRQETATEIESSAGLKEISEDLSNEILKSSIQDLQKGLLESKYTCEDIYLAYTHRIRKESKKFNCILDANIALGLKRARKLDAELKSGKKRGELHGVPISVKDLIAVKGLVSSYGCSSLCQSVQSKDAQLVKMLKKKGAVIYIKSAMSQNAGSYETVNSISGVTTNPIDTTRSSGGSSGGDAVLVATHGTCLGLGTDFGGSLRFPALSCGVFTLKPTSGRLSRSGPLPLLDLPMVRNAWGPLARNVDDIITFFKAVLSEKPNSNIPWVPWNENLLSLNTKLKIGYYLGTDFWPVPACMKRAVIDAKDILESKGYEVVEFQLDNELQIINEVKIGVYAYDPGDSSRLAGEPPLKHFDKIINAINFPNPLKGLYEKYLKYTYGEKESFYYKSLSMRSADDYIKNLVKIHLLKNSYFERVRKLELDVILFPYPFPAIPHDFSVDLLPGFSYLSLFNVLDCPVGSVPLGVVREDEQDYEGVNELWVGKMQQLMANSQGLPTGVQVAGLPYREEAVLKVMKALS